MLRRIVLAFGVGFAALGVAVVAAPGVTTTIRLPDVPPGVVGLVAIGFALSVYVARKTTEYPDPEEAAVENALVEGRFEPPRPGEEVDAEFAAGVEGAERGTDEARLRERLRLLTVRVLENAEGWSREEAHRRLDDGTWTDDRTAAALFSSDVPPPARDVVSTIAGFETTYEREVHAVLAELRRRSGVDLEVVDRDE